MSRLSRRRFVAGAGAAGLGLVAGCGRLPWQAAAPAKVPRVGALSMFDRSNAVVPAREAALVQSLRDLGYVEGQNILLEWRYAGGRAEQLAVLAEELVRLPVDVIVTSASVEAEAARQITATIPIVMANSGDPVAQGLVASLAHPGGNITGLTNISRQLNLKRLELIKAVVPTAVRVAVLWNPTNPAKRIEIGDVQQAAPLMHLDLQLLEVREPGDFAGAFEAAASGGAAALIVLGDPLTVAQSRRIVDFATANRLPSMFEIKAAAEMGGLIAYGQDELQRWRRAAYYVDRILKGARPADLPVEQPMVFDLVVNLKTARELGLTLPPEILLQITEVVE
jgi:putative ABC transport system substrate-binding protein